MSRSDLVTWVVISTLRYHQQALRPNHHWTQQIILIWVCLCLTLAYWLRFDTSNDYYHIAHGTTELCMAAISPWAQLQSLAY